MSSPSQSNLYKKPITTSPITKLIIPSIPANYLRRPRLNKRFQDATKHKLILVTAPAGYGKTAFLIESLQNIGHPIAWVSLDPRDDNMLRFWDNIIMSIQQIQPLLGQETMNKLQSGEQFMEAAITELINEIIEFVPDLCIVLDDYHCINSKAIHDSLVFLINYLPPEAHLIISSRMPPPLSLARLRGQGHLSEIKTADLRFTMEETSQFLIKVMDSPLDDIGKIQSIHSRIEGWIAGLQMIIVSIQGINDFNNLLVAFQGSNKDILNYLTNEVLGQQEEYIRQFLLETSILNRLTGALCNAVTGREDSQRILETLVTKNLFLQPIDNEGEWFRYHSLFSDALYRQLIATQPDMIVILHSRASRWFENEGFIEDAMDHALNADSIDHAIDLINHNAPTIVGDDKHILLLNWANKLPKDLIDQSLWANIACAVACRATRQPEKQRQFGSVALSINEAMLITTHQDPLYSAHISGSLAFIMALDAYDKGDVPQAIKHAENGIKSLPDNEVRARCGLNCVIGCAHWLQGDLIESYQCFVEAIRAVKLTAWPWSACLSVSLAAHTRFALGRFNSTAAACHEAIQIGTMQDGREISSSSFAYLLLAQILYQQNCLEEAKDKIFCAVRLSKDGQEPIIWLSCQMALARISIAQGKVDAGMEIAFQAKIAYERKYPKNSLADIFMTRLWLMAGDGSTAADYTNPWFGLLISPTDRLAKEKALFGLFQNGIYNNDIKNIWVETPLFTYVRVKLAQGHLDGLIELLASVHKDVEAKKWKVLLIETTILQALVFNAMGNFKAALAPLRKALDLTANEQYLRVFVDEGQPMRLLIERALGRGIAPNYIPKILSVFDATSNSAYPKKLEVKLDSLSGSLTKREFEIFQLIYNGASNQDIANKLFISLSTVKNHIHSIYGKLDVDNRTALKYLYQNRN